MAPFSLGRLVATPGALRALSGAGQEAFSFVRRHNAGDWGDVDAHDKAVNDRALEDGSRILSVYHLQDGTKIYIITDAEDDAGIREHTTILLPDEY